MSFNERPHQLKEARLRYLDADVQVLQEGDFVRCADTGVAIPLQLLRYWDVQRQLPYASAEAAFAHRAGAA